ncbi:MAG: GlmU family protein [Bacteroidales bacterium]|jgi:UDP-N-acetylglucosamine diphosphorylase/glucosamine-1-phosphate N-acetyltransferase|nr:GlmU family protein [Bacteroidales bacterium]MDD4384305.1 GlmU family protein [Bacteroidales bacterium]MDY0196752.1 GlmU family protein [Tenuifilaceae bacterium]
MAKHIILFDDYRRDQLLPLTYTRPVSHIRVGILTIVEKWEKYFNQTCYSLTQDYLSTKFPMPHNDGSDCLLINGGVLPTKTLINRILELKTGEALIKGQTIVAAILPHSDIGLSNLNLSSFNTKFEFDGEITEITQPWDIFRLNGIALEADWKLITKGRKSQAISATNKVINPENIFIEEGATIECAVLNAKNGPIYIGTNAEVMEGSLIRGPFALCNDSTLKLGAKIYGPTTIGPHCKVGGEVNNCVVFGYSNKAHDGFIGNSVIGEWCNIGADTNTSNLKNNYANVKLWSYLKQGFVDTGLQFCGLIMGDHSKCGINTMFNTGTVVGVSANIFGDGFPRNFIPSFSWGGAQGFSIYTTKKAFETTSIVLGRRGLELNQIEKDILSNIFDQTAKYRH